MATLQRAQPGVLQLLVAPQRGQPLGVAAEHVAAASRGRGEIEHRAIGVEDARPDPGKSCLGHQIPRPEPSRSSFTAP